MGFVMLGVYALNDLGIKGAVMQMVAHGLSTAALFMLAGALQHRLHTRDMRQMGGSVACTRRAWAPARCFSPSPPWACRGLATFIAEFLVLLGLFAVHPWMTALAAVGMVTGAVYSLWLLQQAFFGTPDDTRPFADFGAREMLTMGGMMIALLWLGLYPQPVLDLVQPVLRGMYGAMSQTLVSLP
jgi:NADH-quinone oxidoreductase subunit M